MQTSAIPPQTQVAGQIRYRRMQPPRLTGSSRQRQHSRATHGQGAIAIKHLALRHLLANVGDFLNGFAKVHGCVQLNLSPRAITLYCKVIGCKAAVNLFLVGPSGTSPPQESHAWVFTARMTLPACSSRFSPRTLAPQDRARNLWYGQSRTIVSIVSGLCERACSAKPLRTMVLH